MEDSTGNTVNGVTVVYNTTSNSFSFTTGTTGKKVKHAGIKNVVSVQPGPLGGDAQIASLVVEGEIDLIIFLRDPLGKHPHDVDISMLMRLADVHNVPLATNYKTASYLIKYFKNK